VHKATTAPTTNPISKYSKEEQVKNIQVGTSDLSNLLSPTPNLDASAESNYGRGWTPSRDNHASLNITSSPFRNRRRGFMDAITANAASCLAPSPTHSAASRPAHNSFSYLGGSSALSPASFI
jgi:hypothetical protein